MPTLLEALEHKYGGSQLVQDEMESLVSIYVPKLPPRLCVPTLLVLNDCDIDKAGEAEDLKQKCCSVKELDLAQNKLKNWKEVFAMLENMPQIEFVNLSCNRLCGPVRPPKDCTMNRLCNLVLNQTCLDWNSIHALINFLPALVELHLSLNEYDKVLIDTITADHDDNNLANECAVNDNTRVSPDDKCPGENGDGTRCSCPSNDTDTVCQFNKTDAHLGVKRLHFTGNPITAWTEICRLGRVFPNLQALVLAECPLKAVHPLPKANITSPTSSPTIKSPNGSYFDSDSNDKEELVPPHEYFKNLTFLNLSSTKINTWDDIDRLANFPSLRNLRVQNWPLWDQCEATEHERRQLLIARLPYVETLNGGGRITTEEREDAERAFIRYYMDKPESDQPLRYNQLVSVHGKLDPLVNIDLRPEKRVKITFTCGDRSEEKTVDVHRTVIDLKSRLEGMAGISAAKMRLFYVDQDLRDHQGPEEMKYPHKRLYSYNIQSGDEIIIDQKH